MLRCSPFPVKTGKKIMENIEKPDFGVNSIEAKSRFVKTELAGQIAELYPFGQFLKGFIPFVSDSPGKKLKEKIEQTASFRNARLYAGNQCRPVECLVLRDRMLDESKKLRFYSGVASLLLCFLLSAAIKIFQREAVLFISIVSIAVFAAVSRSLSGRKFSFDILSGIFDKASQSETAEKL